MNQVSVVAVAVARYQIIPLLSLLTISLSSAVLCLLRYHPHYIETHTGRRIVHWVISHMSYKTCRYVHIAAYIIFVTITSIASTLELLAICYCKRYDVYSYAVEVLDRYIVLPLLTIGNVSGVIMVLMLLFQKGKCLEPTLGKVVQIFNGFGLFWIVMDVALRNTVLLSYENKSMKFPIVLFLVRLFVNAVCMRIIFLLRQLMQSLALSIHDEKFKK